MLPGTCLEASDLENKRDSTGPPIAVFRLTSAADRLRDPVQETMNEIHNSPCTVDVTVTRLLDSILYGILDFFRL